MRRGSGHIPIDRNCSGPVPERLLARAAAIADALLDLYGMPEVRHHDPLDELVLTILSQNTNDANRDRAWSSLRQRFPTWDAVLEAPETEVEVAIRVGGLAATKAAAVRAALARLRDERGVPSLDHLAAMPPEDALRYLLSFEGVGRKTASIVLLFSLGVPAFPVDTHVHRVTRRIGLIGEGTSRDAAHDELARLFPEERYLEVHVNIIEHGRAVCLARVPDCPDCAIRSLCDHGTGR
ncbi:MAG: hypothetical protein L0Z54_04865 [Thermoplasmata archaeon]|nr:hypothetical protein [Thermoplasmata archaeon]